MNLRGVIGQLDGLGYKATGGALEFAGLRNLPGRLPAAYAVLEDDRAEASRNATQIIDQLVTVNFAVVMIMNAVQRQDNSISDEFTALCKATRDRMIGWEPEPSWAPVQYGGGRLLSVDGTALTWALRFRSSYHIRKGR